MRCWSTATPNGCPGAGTLAKTVVSPIAGWLAISPAKAVLTPGLSAIVAKTATEMPAILLMSILIVLPDQMPCPTGSALGSSPTRFGESLGLSCQEGAG